MNGDHPTTADFAMSMADSNARQQTALEDRVNKAEAHIDYLVEILSALLDEQYEGGMSLPPKVKQAVMNVPSHLKG